MTDISSLDRGFQLGDGVFDTALVLNGKMIFQELHLERLVRAAHSIGIPVALSEIEAELSLFLALHQGHDIVRITISRGVTARGLWPQQEGPSTIRITSSPWDRSMVGQSAGVMISSIRRNETSPTSCLKSLSYLDNILAMREAVHHGYDEALMLNTQGFLACSTMGNIFIIKEGRLLTPPREAGVLDGIIRKVILERSSEWGFPAAEQALREEDLKTADGVFLTNSLRWVRPVTRLKNYNLARCEPLQAVLVHHFSLLHYLA
jgi:branched-chain amino acid aminotransferase